MTAVDDVDELIENYQLALDEFMKGNPEPVKKLFSHREDSSLANPYGPPVRGWKQVTEVVEHAASLRRDGQATGFEIVAKNVTPELAYVVQIERLESKVGEREEITPYALRATMIFRPEDGVWKVVHRHADPITTPQPAESVIQQ
ncbi:MAG TPA: nuclear transport factor 2 family protein [Rubrobacter sp.]|nr:nuclear transport factor 2 family protein [Rubrobacter sp.]